MLVDHFGAARAADIVGDKFSLDRGGREPFVPQPDGKVCQFRKVAGEGAGGLRARPFAAMHVDRQTKDESDAGALTGDFEQFSGILCYGLALSPSRTGGWRPA